MKRKMVLFAAIVAGALIPVSLATGTSAAKSIKFTATLTAGQEKHPSPKGTKAGAGGTFTATLTGSTLKWTLTWKNLTGPANQAHIHQGAKGVSGNVLVSLCPPGCKSGMSGKSVLTAPVLKLLKSGATYVNVHTNKNLNGEIRGQIVRAS